MLTIWHLLRPFAMATPSTLPALALPANPRSLLSSHPSPSLSKPHLSLSPTFPHVALLATTVAAASFPAHAAAATFAARSPLGAAAAGLAKLLHLYSGVLMVRVLLSWFPDVPWRRQPLAALRGVCDPYLAFYRRALPPVFAGSLDLTPLLAFAVLRFVAQLLRTAFL